MGVLSGENGAISALFYWLKSTLGADSGLVFLGFSPGFWILFSAFMLIAILAPEQ